MKSSCSMAMLESALAGNMPADEEGSLHRHIEECEECGAALEQMAGGPTWCQEAAALLIEDELDAALPARDEWSAIDFTVEHLQPSDDPNVLGRLGGYNVLEVIGHGGMGVVLKAFDPALNRYVAIKVLAPHLAQSSLAKKRFVREAQAAAAVVHPHVLAIHQVQPSGRLPFLVMPLVAGESLAERLKAQGTLELKEILRIGMQAAAGLAAAHEQGLVHRDVKPANILLEMGVERAVLTDFGLARAADDATLTRWGVIAGTPQYMSPEQARGEPLDGRSDLFSLGCVLYEMATGVSPFRSDSLMATMRRLVDDAPQAIESLNPELPPWFIAIIERLLEKEPSRRFESAQELSEVLGECLAHVQQPASVPLPATLAGAARRRGWRPPKIGLNRVIAMLAAFGIGLVAVMAQVTDPPDIAGEWTGEEWGRVALNKVNDGEYSGTYTDTFGPRPGEIQLKWSRIERRFNGTWREGEDRFGEISLRLVGDEIRGANTTDVKSKINPGTPRLADLSWSRGTAKDAPEDSTTRGVQPGDIPDEKYIAQDQERAKVSFKVATLAWGEANNGLRLAAVPDPDTAKIGEPIPFFLVVENVSDHDIKFSARDVAQSARADVRRTNGNQVETQNTMYSGFPPIEYYRLRPGQQAVIANPSVMVVENGNTERKFGSTRVVLPGDTDLRNNMFVVRYSVDIGLLESSSRGSDGKMQRTSPLEGEWTGTLTSGQMAINATRSAEDAKPASGEATSLTPKRVHHFETGSVGNSIKIAYSGDAKRIAVANGNPTLIMQAGGTSRVKDNWKPSVNILDAETGKSLVALNFNTAEENAVLAATERVSHVEATALAFSPDGNVLAVGTSMGQVKLFNSRTGELIQSLVDEAANPADQETPENWKPLARAMGSVASLAFSPDGSLLAMCGDSFADFADRKRLGLRGTGPGRLKLWDVQTGTLKYDLAGHSHVFATAFSPDGQLLASAGRWSDQGDLWGSGIIIWNALTGKPIHKLIRTTTNGRIRSIAFSPDSTLLAIGTQSFFDQDAFKDASTGAVSVTHVDSGIVEWLQTVPGWANPVAFSPDGMSVAALCGGQSIRFLDIATGATKDEIGTADTPEKGRWIDFAIPSQGHRLAIAGIDAERRGFIDVWEPVDLPAAAQ